MRELTFPMTTDFPMTSPSPRPYVSETRKTRCERERPDSNFAPCRQRRPVAWKSGRGSCAHLNFRESAAAGEKARKMSGFEVDGGALKVEEEEEEEGFVFVRPEFSEGAMMVRNR